MDKIILSLICLMLAACKEQPANYPYGKYSAREQTFFSSFSSVPKTLDPAKSYSTDEVIFTAQIFEPPLQYQFNNPNNILEPLATTSLPKIDYYDEQNHLVLANGQHKIAKTVYTIDLKPSQYYAPHPAFAQDSQGRPLYLNLTDKERARMHALKDFPKVGKRLVRADDFVYQIKRLADPKLNSPIYTLMSDKIIGFKELHEQLSQAPVQGFVDLRNYPLNGVKVLNNNRFQISLKGYYPQFIYWLAMPFFAPTPWEADAFYAQTGFYEKGIGFNWNPVGSGAYYLAHYQPEYQIVLQKNPFYTGSKDLAKIATFIFTLEKESIPRWYKFLQGYYDESGIAAENFQQAILFNAAGQPILSPALQKKGIVLQTQIQPSIFYIGFNFLDPIIGQNGLKSQKLRQALNLSIDFDEYIKLFLNGRGQRALGPLPPDIFKDNFSSPYKSSKERLQKAKALLEEAGYPEGIDPKTKRPLVLTLSFIMTGSPDERSQWDWFRQQVSSLGIDLRIDPLQYPRFQEKIRSGNAQLFFWGWSADYPDPENFLFLFYGNNTAQKSGGENTANYVNSDFDALFEAYKQSQDIKQKTLLLQKMLSILRDDQVWIFGFYPKAFILSQAWVKAHSLNSFVNNYAKYLIIDSSLRVKAQKNWNQAHFLSLIFLLLLLCSLGLLIYFYYRKLQNQAAVRSPKEF